MAMRADVYAALVGILAVGAPAATAQQVNDCDWPAQIRNIVEPWEEKTRTFANGNIRIVHVDTGGEPVCCSSHLVILAPDPQDEQGYRQCKVVSDGDTGQGFNWIEFGEIDADYDPAKGLALTVPIFRYVADTGGSKKSTIRVRINQATGAITIE